MQNITSSTSSPASASRSEMSDLLLDAARDMAFEAGAILLRYFRSASLAVSYKKNTDMVTEADRESEEYLVSRISREFPEHAILAEEGGGREAGGGFLWIVDPLDGTNNFAHGLPFFCVSIGVYSMESKRVVSAVVYNPFLDEMFTAVRDGGSFCNGEPIRVSQLDDIGISLVATGFPYDKAESPDNNLREFNRVVPRVQGIRRMGSAAIDLSYVACGRLDGFWEGKLKPWDTAAGSLIVEEAGGRVSRYDGDPFDPWFPQILATNGRIHDSLSRILTQP